MKNKYITVVLLLFTVSTAVAQKQSDPLPYNKEHLDSMFRQFPKLQQPFVYPAPKGYNLPENAVAEYPATFEAVNPGASAINKTAGGTVYNIPLDNMAVLVPDMKKVENMPSTGSRLRMYKEQDNMPNPLYQKPLSNKFHNKMND